MYINSSTATNRVQNRVSDSHSKPKMSTATLSVVNNNVVLHKNAANYHKNLFMAGQNISGTSFKGIDPYKAKILESSLTKICGQAVASYKLGIKKNCLFGDAFLKHAMDNPFEKDVWKAVRTGKQKLDYKEIRAKVKPFVREWLNGVYEEAQKSESNPLFNNLMSLTGLGEKERTGQIKKLIGFDLSSIEIGNTKRLRNTMRDLSHKSITKVYEKGSSEAMRHPFIQEAVMDVVGKDISNPFYTPMWQSITDQVQHGVKPIYDNLLNQRTSEFADSWLEKIADEKKESGNTLIDELTSMMRHPIPKEEKITQAVREERIAKVQERIAFPKIGG